MVFLLRFIQIVVSRPDCFLILGKVNIIIDIHKYILIFFQNGGGEQGVREGLDKYLNEL